MESYVFFSFSCNLQETDIDSGTKISVLYMLYEQHLRFHISANSIVFRDAGVTVKTKLYVCPCIHARAHCESFLSALGHAS